MCGKFQKLRFAILGAYNMFENKFDRYRSKVCPKYDINSPTRFARRGIKKYIICSHVAMLPLGYVDINFICGNAATRLGGYNFKLRNRHSLVHVVW